jgi:hypothetical protein
MNNQTETKKEPFTIPEQYQVPFNKETAIEALMEGYFVISLNEMLSESYTGAFITRIGKELEGIEGIQAAKFFRFNIVGKQRAQWKPDQQEEELYALYQFAPQLIPKTLWKSSIKSIFVKQLTFDSILSSGQSDFHYFSTVCLYHDDDNNQHTVELFITPDNFKYN